MKIHCPGVGTTPTKPSQCPLCGGRQLKVKERLRRKIRDQRVNEVEVLKMYCHTCHHCPRIYPEGIVPFKQRSQRLIFLGTLLYLAGLSYQKIEGLLGLMLGNPDWSVSDTTFWRDIQAMGRIVRKKWFQLGRQPRKGIRPTVYTGMDGMYVRVKGQKVCLVIAVDVKGGLTLEVDPVDEHDPSALRKFLVTLLRKYNIKGTVTDDLETYKEPIGDVLGYQGLHQVCLAHAKKSGKVRLKKLQAGKAVNPSLAATLKDIIDNPQASDRQFFLQKLREPGVKHHPKVLRFLQDWYRKLPYFLAYQQDVNLPSTNNCTERAVARTKVRYKTVRGLKSMEGTLNFAAMTQVYGMHQFQKIYQLTNSI